MAATKKSKKSAAQKKSAAKKSALDLLVKAKKPAAKKAKMGRPATYRYFTATVKFREPVDCCAGVRVLQKELAGRLEAYDGVKVIVSEVK